MTMHRSSSLPNTPISSENFSSDQTKLESFFRIVKGKCSEIDRIAVALYDEGSETLKTYLAVVNDENPLKFYEVPLKSVPSLYQVKELKQPRIINDLTVLSSVQTTHSQKITQAGYFSSYTFPMIKNERFLGFIFYNSYQKGYFTKENTEWLELFSLLVTDFINDGIGTAETLMASFVTIR